LNRDTSGVIRFFVDGEIVEDLRITEDELPFLEELNDDFNEIQNVFFGSLSREAMSQSTWDFVNYLVQPTNPQQSTPAIFVSYSGDQLPESSLDPWTPIGYHGYESNLNNHLVLDSTSATDLVTESEVGFIGGDFRGFTRVEPLLSIASNVVLDFNLRVNTFTHGVSPNSVMAAVDDGTRLVQVCFFPTDAQPKVSYPGRSMPQDATPDPWGSLGGATAYMLGRILRIEDSSISDGRVFVINDLEPPTSLSRIFEESIDYYAECRCTVISSVPDGTVENFCGATMDVFDGTRTLGIMLRKDLTLGTPQVAFHSDGQILSGTSTFNFNWEDSQEHTYRITKNTAGDLVVLFVDNVLVGTYAYSGFNFASGNPTLSFGSATTISSLATSVVEWHYVNGWRAQGSIPATRYYVGIWKGSNSDSLLGYHLPLKASGTATTSGNTLTDSSTDFIVAGVASGDDVVIDYGMNQGVYSVSSVAPGGVLYFAMGALPIAGSTVVEYRIVKQTDFRVEHKYRVVRDPGGFIALFLDSDSAPLVQVDYSEVNLPSSSVGVPRLIHRGTPSVTWGCFDPTNISQTLWGFVRYGIVRSPVEVSIVPHHQVLNQRNVVSSPDHLFGSVPHNHTQYSSSSTGVPYPWEEYVNTPGVTAFTKLNELTPIVPLTQTYEVRRPTPQITYLSVLNNPSDVLNSSTGFTLNDSTSEVRLLVPDDVLYNSIQIIEKSSGEEDLISPFTDGDSPISYGPISWKDIVCGTYAAQNLPENDTGFGTPWTLAESESGVSTESVSGGVLTYSIGSSTGTTIYRNPTPLTDPLGLSTRVDFRLRLLNDSSGGIGDSGVRFGFSAIGLTAALAFVATPLGEREVRLLDLNSNTVLGALSFDYLDGNFHTYRLEKNAMDQTIDFSIDPT
jgi:hypothetical protein